MTTSQAEVRALVEEHKTPLLGLEIAWKSKGKGPNMELNREPQAAYFKVWYDLRNSCDVGMKPWNGPDVLTRVAPAKERIDIAHGSFDNDITVFRQALSEFWVES